MLWRPVQQGKEVPQVRQCLGPGSSLQPRSQSAEVEEELARQRRGGKGAVDRGYSRCTHVEMRKNMAPLGPPWREGQETSLQGRCRAHRGSRTSF